MESIRHLPEEVQQKLEEIQLGSLENQQQGLEAHEKLGNDTQENIRAKTGPELVNKSITLEVLVDLIKELEADLSSHVTRQPLLDRNYLYQGLARLDAGELYELIGSVKEAKKVLLSGDAASSANILYNPILEKLQLELSQADTDLRYKETFGRVRERIRNEILESREGLNVGQVLNFFEINKLPIHDYVVIDESEVSKLNDILSTVGMNSALEGSGQGAWYPDLQLAVVVRRAEIESANGSYSTEHYLAHELAHGALRTEVNREDWGYFFDEGSVQAIAEDCSAQILKSGELPAVFRVWQKRTADFGPDFEVSRYEVSQRTVTTTAEEGGVGEFSFVTKLSAELYQKDKNTNELVSIVPIPAIAAYGIELLCDAIPDLQKELRKSPIDVESVRELINSKDPGLFEELNSLRYNLVDFAKGQQIILERLYVSEGDE